MKKSTLRKFETVGQKKLDSLGKTMTVAEACKLCWNSVRVYGEDGIAYYDPERDEFTVDFADDPDEFLKMEITLDDDWREDEDGYPIIYGEKVDED